MRKGLLMATGVLPGLVFAGCMAQQADLTRVERDLTLTIKQQRQELLKELRDKTEEAKTEIEGVKSEVKNEMRARLKADLNALKDEGLRPIEGRLEEHENEFGKLSRRMEDISHGLQNSIQKQIAIVDKKISAVETTQKTQLEQVGFLKLERDRLQREIEKAAGRLDALSTRLQGLSDTMVTTVKAIEGKLEEQDRAMRAGDESVHKVLAGRLDSEAKLLTDQMTAFQRSLSEFKEALASLGEQVSQQEQRRMELTTQFSSRADALRAKVDQDVKTAESHLGEVNRSVQSVAKSLETVSQSLLGRIEEQDRRVEEMAKSLEAAIARINTLNQALSQALLQMQEAGPQKARGRTEPVSSPSDRGSPPPGVERQAPRSRPRTSSTPERQSAPTPPMEVASAISDKDAYDRVMQRFKQGDLGAAQRGFSAFLQTYPTSRLAANAQYWVGECYYGNKEYERAIEAFDLVKRRYPDSDKVAAALLKKGFAYLSLNEPQKASSVLKQVIDGYPHTPEASKAKTRLAQLAQTR